MSKCAQHSFLLCAINTGVSVEQQSSVVCLEGSCCAFLAVTARVFLRSGEVTMLRSIVEGGGGANCLSFDVAKWTSQKPKVCGA